MVDPTRWNCCCSHSTTQSNRLRDRQPCHRSCWGTEEARFQLGPPQAAVEEKAESPLIPLLQILCYRDPWIWRKLGFLAIDKPKERSIKDRRRWESWGRDDGGRGYRERRRRRESHLLFCDITEIDIRFFSLKSVGISYVSFYYWLFELCIMGCVAPLTRQPIFIIMIDLFVKVTIGPKSIIQLRS